MAWTPDLNIERETPKGYHLEVIPRGQHGELSKISEELHEAIDAEKQGNKIMLLVELSDIVAAIDGYLKKHCPSITLDHVANMAKATIRAFESGERK
jgi:hypothetical protein